MDSSYAGRRYSEVQSDSTDGLDLIIRLYARAIELGERARDAMERGDVAEKGILISQTLAIVGELQSSLNLERGGEVAMNLNRLYIYVQQRLMIANLRQDAGALDESLHVLRELHEAWERGSRQDQEDPPWAQPTQPEDGPSNPALNVMG